MALHAEIRNQDGPVGEVHVVGGLATPSNEAAREIMATTQVVLPGPKPVRPEQGEDYVRGLARCLNGTYLWAELRQG